MIYFCTHSYNFFYERYYVPCLTEDGAKKGEARISGERMKERMKAVGGRRGERKLDTPLESRILFVMVNAAVVCSTLC